MDRYTTDPTAAGRNLQIDALRGIAILGVLARHLVLFTKPNRWDALPIRAGWAGVDLFFVLSGFLIGGLLFAEFRRNGRIDFPRFAIRRALRIYPAFWFLLGITILVRTWTPLLRSQVLHDLFFLQSYLPGTWGHFWSLSVEEHFYVLLPVFLYVLMKLRARQSNPFRILPGAFAIVALLALIGRLLTAHFVPFSWQTHLFPTHLRLDSLFFGVLLAYWLHFFPEKFAEKALRYRSVLPIVAAIFIAPAFVFSQYDPVMYTWGFTSLYLGFGALLVCLLYLPPNPILHSRPVRGLAYIGVFSYSIYLWQTAWLMLISRAHLLSSALFVVGAILVGIAMDKLIDQPVLGLRNRLFPARSAAVAGFASAGRQQDPPRHHSPETINVLPS